MSLVDYAKTGHREAMQVWEDCGRHTSKAAGILNISPSTVRDYVTAVKSKAAVAGYSDNWVG